MIEGCLVEGMSGHGVETVQGPTVSTTGVHNLPYGEELRCLDGPLIQIPSKY